MSVNLKPIVVLISGRGSNLKSLIEQSKNYKIVNVITNNPDAAGLQIAKEHGIPYSSFNRKEFSSLQQFKEAIYKEIDNNKPAYIALAGFMQIIESALIERYTDRIINIHPSLLPKFPGLHTHQQAIKAGVKMHGCSVHLVDEGIDTGAVIAQAEVTVEPRDTEESLAQKVLKREHELYPWVINALTCGEISVSDRKIHYSTIAVRSAEERGFLLIK